MTGAAVLIYTSELPEIPLVCDRVLVLYTGRVVHEQAAATATEEGLLSAAHGLGADGVTRHRAARHHVGGVDWPRWRRRQGWSVGVWLLLVVLIAWYTPLVPDFGNFQIASIAKNSLPLIYLAIGQAVIVIAGGIDLSARGDDGAHQSTAAGPHGRTTVVRDLP